MPRKKSPERDKETSATTPSIEEGVAVTAQTEGNGESKDNGSTGDKQVNSSRQREKNAETNTQKSSSKNNKIGSADSPEKKRDTLTIETEELEKITRVDPKRKKAADSTTSGKGVPTDVDTEDGAANLNEIDFGYDEDSDSDEDLDGGEDFDGPIEYEEVEYDIDECAPDTIIDSKFKIISLLGSGGLSAVYLAEHLYLQKPVALKIFLPVDADENVRFARIQREAITLANISHPNIVGVTDLGITGVTPYIVQEFVDGVDLKQLLSRDGCFTEERCIHLFSQICDGIAFLHDFGIVHRDIKPANVIVSWSKEGVETAKLIDLGIAKQDNPGGALHAFTTSGSIFGSPFYMSPEQCKGGNIDKRSDIYSLGCLMYEVLTGLPPFRGPTMLVTLEKHTREPAEPVNSKRRDNPVSAKLEAIVMKCLEKNPDDRYQRSAEVCKALKSLARGSMPVINDKRVIAAGLLLCFVPLVWMMASKDESVPKTKSPGAPFADRHVSAVLNKIEKATLFDGTTSNKVSQAAYEEALTEAERQKAPIHIQLDIAERLARLYSLERNRNSGDKLEGLYIRVKTALAAVERSHKAGTYLKGEPAGSATLLIYYAANNALEEHNYPVATQRLYRALNLASKAPEELRLIQKINTKLAQLKVETGSVAEGTALYESTLKDAIADLGEDDASVITLSNKLVNIYAGQGKIEQASAHLKVIRKYLSRRGGSKIVAQFDEDMKKMLNANAKPRLLEFQP